MSILTQMDVHYSYVSCTEVNNRITGHIVRVHWWLLKVQRKRKTRCTLVLPFFRVHEGGNHDHSFEFGDVLVVVLSSLIRP